MVRLIETKRAPVFKNSRRAYGNGWLLVLLVDRAGQDQVDQPAQPLELGPAGRRREPAEQRVPLAGVEVALEQAGQEVVDDRPVAAQAGDPADRIDERLAAGVAARDDAVEEVRAVQKGRRAQPGRPAVPALDAGRIEQLLLHRAQAGDELLRQLSDLERLERADHELDRALDRG